MKDSQAVLALALSEVEQAASMLRGCQDGAERSGSPPSRENIYRKHLRGELYSLIQTNEYKTNDLIRLIGQFETRKECVVNAKHIELDMREFVFLRAIIDLAMEGCSLEGGSGYFTAGAILVRVKKLFSEKQLEAVWPYPGPEDIHRIVHGLRKALASSRLNPWLIESARRGDGYRLSTPVWNLEAP
jgi:hypothetical protein